jgi:hypothetical protein
MRGRKSTKNGRPLHCWEDGGSEWREDETGEIRRYGSTCMRPAGHRGPHRYTPDDAIAITFKEASDAR